MEIDWDKFDWTTMTVDWDAFKWNVKKDVLGVVKYNGDLLQNASPDLKDDFEVVLAAIQSKNHLAAPLQYASIRLRDNTEIVTASTKHNPYFTLQYTSDRFKDNEEIVMACVMKSGGTAFRYASKELRNNLEIAKSAILASARTSSAFNVYQLCSKRVKEDKEVIASLDAKGVPRFRQRTEMSRLE